MLLLGENMELKREHWDKKDFEELRTFEESIKGDDNNCEWEKRIVNTALPCMARTSSKARQYYREIKKGNYIEFLDNIEIKTHFESLVCAYLICSIKDFDTFEKYLNKYVITIDNWASADTLKFAKKDYSKLYNLSQKYLTSEMPYVRRVGVDIYFELIKDDNYIDKAFALLDNLKDEKEYYVNMCGAWLLSFCMVRNPEKTLTYFKDHHTNKFIINKAISKCHDSYRIDNSTKELLKQYRIK